MMRNSRSDLRLNVVGSVLVGLLFCYLFSGDSGREATASEVFTTFLWAFGCYAAASLLTYLLTYKSEPRPILTCVVAAGIGSLLFSSYLILPLAYADPSLLGGRIIGLIFYTLLLPYCSAPLLMIAHLPGLVLRRRISSQPAR
jgi:hypothetical protein